MIKTELEALRHELPEGVTLVAVSKFHPVEALREAYDAGQRVFGESRAQELQAKAPLMPADTQWHFIGHLQTNKVRPVVSHAALIHSVDSPRLLRAIAAEARRQQRRTDVLLQLHVAQEETKFGFTPDELRDFLASGEIEELADAVRVRGVMGMASNVDDTDRIRADFRAIRAALPEGCDIVSMGMSDDWQIAVEEGANMVRIGSRIFGAREY
ncbi:MAG: YggS family pyridoxal phosphate-dependent enzyme [Duncaniella sp.]|nr:YggS family pyridoxal phosphate-dependent enzyme [Duncaniella sp.]